MESWTVLLNELENKRSTYTLSKYDEKLLLFITYLAIPNNINFERFNKNFSILRELPVISSTVELGSMSMKLIANKNDIIPKGYENFFIAAFPDVYIWVQANMETDKDLISLFDRFQLFQSSIIDERDKFSISFCKDICMMFLKKGFVFELASD